MINRYVIYKWYKWQTFSKYCTNNYYVKIKLYILYDSLSFITVKELEIKSYAYCIFLLILPSVRTKWKCLEFKIDNSQGLDFTVRWIRLSLKLLFIQETDRVGFFVILEILFTADRHILITLRICWLVLTLTRTRWIKQAPKLKWWEAHC